jgi:hypothetical protein
VLRSSGCRRSQQLRAFHAAPQLEPVASDSLACELQQHDATTRSAIRQK